MNEILAEFYENGVGVYIDDMYVYSKDMRSHLRTLGKLFDKLERENFTVSLKKC